MAKQNLQKIAEWQKENTDFIAFRARKELCIPDRIQRAVAAGKASSRQEYITKAILAALERDGIADEEIPTDE